MRSACIAWIVVLISVASGGPVYAAGEGSTAAGALSAPVAGDLLRGIGPEPSSSAYVCADLAETESFRSRRLAYVRSGEFAEAVSAVANGESRYSPAEIPGEWRAAAAAWKTGSPFREGAEPCNAVLVYLASLEYRSRPGHEGVAPAFPRVVRTASGELRERVAAKRRMAAIYEQRVAAIGAKIVEAERMGARDCQPSELARAKDALESAHRSALGVRSDLREAEAELARADMSAEALLAKRQYAARRGVNCIPD